MTGPTRLAKHVQRSLVSRSRVWRANRKRTDPGAHRLVGRIRLDYPVDPRPRWGYATSTHPLLSAIIGRGRSEYDATLRSVLELREQLTKIPVHAPRRSREPRWINGALPGLDAAVLYAMVARHDPATYLEIGSGQSTRFARRACVDHRLRTEIVSIDPAPGVEVDDLCDEVLRVRLEEVDLELFDRLHAGDILFVDNSHRCFQNSDVTVTFLDILPALRPGVLVHFHDIFLPDDYPLALVDHFYSEQYLLAAALLADGPHLQILMPNWYASADAELGSILDPLWDDPRFEGVQRHGASFWLVKR